MIRQVTSLRELGMKSNAADSITSPDPPAMHSLPTRSSNSIVTNLSSAPDIASVTFHHCEYPSLLGRYIARLRRLDLHGMKIQRIGSRVSLRTMPLSSL